MRVPRLRSAILIGALSLLLVPASRAGFGGQGVVPVPITEEGLDKDALDIFDRRKAAGEDVSYPPFEDVPPARIALLKQFPPFSGMSDEEVVEKVRQMRRAIICVIDLIGREDRETGEALQRLLRLRKICFGLTQSDNGIGMSIFPDGREEFGIEPINVFYRVCKDLDLSSPALFELYVALSHESLHGNQSILRPTGRPNFAETVDLQCREVEAHEGEMERINEMVRILEFIESNGELPPDARGATASFGASIVHADNTAELLKEWLEKLLPMQEQRGYLLQFRRIYKEAGQAFLDGDADAEAIREQLEPYRQWVLQLGRRRDFSQINTAIFSEAPVIVGPRGSRTVQPPEGGGMKQYLVPDLELVTIDTGTDLVSGAEFDADESHLYFIGVTLGTPNTGMLGRFEIDQTNGAVMEETLEVCLSSEILGQGGQLLRNPFETEDPFYLVKGPGADLWGFLDDDDDGCPDSMTHLGALPQGPSFSIGYAEFIEQDTLFGHPEVAGTVPDANQPFSLAVREPPGTEFFGIPPQTRGHAITTPPAPAGLPLAGLPHLPCAGTPGESFEIHLIPPSGPPVAVGSGTFGWRGHANPALDAPFGAGDVIRIVDGSGAASPDFPAVPAPGSTPGFIDNDPFGRIGDPTRIEVGVTSWPGQPIIGEQTTDPSGIWTESPPITANCHGEAFFPFDGPAQPGAPPRNFFRFDLDTVPPPPGVPPDHLQQFEVPPGVPVSLDLSIPGEQGCLSYELVSPPNVNDALFQWNNDGTFTTTLLTFGGPISFTYRKQLLVPEVPFSPEVTVIVSPVDNRLVNPEPYVGEDGVEYVNALVLEYGALLYPLYQFSLSNNPQDTCTEPHWHRSFYYGDLVYPLEFPANGIPDPDPPGCGFGTYPDVAPELLALPLADWQAYQATPRP